MLGLNAKLSITKELLNVLTEKGIKQENPKQILKSLYYQASLNHIRDEQIAKHKKLGFKKICI
jgi:hypothetical protein